MRKIIHSLFGCTFFINKYWLHFYKYKECTECGKRYKQVKCTVFGDKSWKQVKQEINF